MIPGRTGYEHEQEQVDRVLREGHLASGYSQPAVKYSLVDIDAKWCEDPAKRRQDKGYNDHQGASA